MSFGHRGYRAAALSLDLAGFDGGRTIGARAEPCQPDENLAGRGTLLHRSWSGEDPAVFEADQGVHLDVSCASPTDALELPVPYALAVTIEVGAASEIDVYTPIRARISTPIQLRLDGAAPDDLGRYARRIADTNPPWNPFSKVKQMLWLRRSQAVSRTRMRPNQLVVVPAERLSRSNARGQEPSERSGAAGRRQGQRSSL